MIDYSHHDQIRSLQSNGRFQITLHRLISRNPKFQATMTVSKKLNQSNSIVRQSFNSAQLIQHLLYYSLLSHNNNNPKIIPKNFSAEMDHLCFQTDQGKLDCLRRKSNLLNRAKNPSNASKKMIINNLIIPLKNPLSTTVR